MDILQLREEIDELVRRQLLPFRYQGPDLHIRNVSRYIGRCPRQLHQIYFRSQGRACSGKQKMLGPDTVGQRAPVRSSGLRSEWKSCACTFNTKYGTVAAQMYGHEVHCRRTYEAGYKEICRPIIKFKWLPDLFKAPIILDDDRVRHRQRLKLIMGDVD